MKIGMGYAYLITEILIIISLIGLSAGQPVLKVTETAFDVTNNKPLIGGDSILPDIKIRYNIVVENIGLDNALDVCLTDWLSPEVQFVKIPNTPKGVIIISQPDPSLDSKSPLQTDKIDILLGNIPPGEDNKKEIIVEVMAPPKKEGPIALYNHILIRAKNVKQNVFDEFRLVMATPYEVSNDCDKFYGDCGEINFNNPKDMGGSSSCSLCKARDLP
jgi:uncharacterized repeat protein (TIGR01451 family)